MTKKVKEFIMPISGETVLIFPVSLTSISMRLRREMPAPLPPVVNVVIAGVETSERNYADPHFSANLQIWREEIYTKTLDYALKRIALKQKLTKDQKAEVAEIRQAFADETHPQNDKLLWFYEVAVGGDPDITAVIEAAAAMADPQEKRIAATANGFSS